MGIIVKQLWSNREIELLCDFMASDNYTMEEIAWLMNRTYYDVSIQWRMIVERIEGPKIKAV